MNASGHDIAAAVLAGGQASRFSGVAKGLLRLPDGATLVEHMLCELAAAGTCDVAVFSDGTAEYGHLGVPVLPDRRQGIGPLGGIEAALFHFGHRYRGVLLLPCDLPAITRHEIGRLCSAFAKTDAPVVVAETAGEFWHPLCAVVRADLADTVSRRIGDGMRSVYRLWLALGASPVRFGDPSPFFNVNTPEDWAEWLGLVERSRSLAR